MVERDLIQKLLTRRGWRILGRVDLGTVSQITLFSNGTEELALKTARGTDRSAQRLRFEYGLLCSLHRTPLRRWLPRIGEWLSEVCGFTMQALRYPTPAERSSASWQDGLWRAMSSLHAVGLPSVDGLPDDRPDMGAALAARMRSTFRLLDREHGHWDALQPDDRARLQVVRSHYAAHERLLPRIAAALRDTQPAVTHGDLSGDNLMIGPEG